MVTLITPDAAAANMRRYDSARILAIVSATFDKKMELDPELFVEDDFELEDFEEAWDLAEAYLNDQTVELAAFLLDAWRKAIDFGLRSGLVDEDEHDFERLSGLCVCYELFRWIADKHFNQEVPQ